jgi:glucose/arabinose dehydrogenase
VLTAIVLIAASTACGGASVSPTATPSTELVDIGQGLQGPAGLSATIYATGIVNAAAFAFDAQGRLWVATAAFQDTGDDAVYLVASPSATPVKVIEGLHTALGLLWYDGELYVSSKERVDAYSGFDGAHFEQTRQVLALPAGIGESNGLIMSPEGRIILGVSAPCNACTPASQYSAAVLSFLPDGSDLRVDASGIRAPIDFAYYPGTSDLFVTVNQRDDLGDATLGDWLAWQRPVRDREPARRPGRRHARRLASAGQAG